MSFDPYYTWLGIPPEEQPASHYRLLGIREFESNLDVIANAADRQMTYIRTLKTSRHAKRSQQLLNEISAARVCLLNDEERSAYDAKLRGGNRDGQRVVEPRLSSSAPPVPGKRAGKGSKAPPPLPMSAQGGVATNSPGGNGSPTARGGQETPVANAPPVPTGEVAAEVPLEFAANPNSPLDPSSFDVDAGEYGLAKAEAVPRYTVPLDSALQAVAAPEKPAAAKMAPGSPFGKPASVAPASSSPHNVLAIVAASAALSICFAVILIGSVMAYMLSRSDGGSEVARAGSTDDPFETESEDAADIMETPSTEANSTPADGNAESTMKSSVTAENGADAGMPADSETRRIPTFGGVNSNDLLDNSTYQSPPSSRGFGVLPEGGSSESGTFGSPGVYSPEVAVPSANEYGLSSEETPPESEPDRVDPLTVETAPLDEPLDTADATLTVDSSGRLPEPTGEDRQRAADLQRDLRTEFDTVQRNPRSSLRYRPRTQFPAELHSKVSDFLSRAKYTSDPAEQWAYLQAALEHAEEIHNRKLALASVNALVGRFDVDEVGLRLQYFRTFLPLAMDGSDSDKLLFAREALSYVDDAVEKDHLIEAEFLCNRAIDLATGADNTDLKREARIKQQEVHKLRQEAKENEESTPVPMDAPAPPSPTPNL